MVLPDFSQTEEEYTGDKTSCDTCNRPFEQGDIIVVEKTEGGSVFCFSDPSESGPLGRCAMAYFRKFRKVVVARHMRFKRKSDAQYQVRPEDIVDKTEEEKAEDFSRAKKLLEF